VTLTWKPLYTKKGHIENYAIGSACGTYTVAKVIVSGRAIFEAFHGSACIGYERAASDSDYDIAEAAEKAKAICQRHANGEPLAIINHENNDGV
jgi:hypothetical protein